MANENQKKTAAMLAAEFERSVIGMYEAGGELGTVWAFDIDGGAAGILTVVWSIVPRPLADQLKVALDRAVN